MPVGRLAWRHALIGGVTATVLWEITRHVLVWYFATLSQVTVVYGSLTTAIVVLLSLEIGATLLLFGAQVISEYERIGHARRPRRSRRCSRTAAAVSAWPSGGEQPADAIAQRRGRHAPPAGPARPRPGRRG